MLHCNALTDTDSRLRPARDSSRQPSWTKPSQESPEPTLLREMQAASDYRKKIRTAANADICSPRVFLIRSKLDGRVRGGKKFSFLGARNFLAIVLWHFLWRWCE